MIYLAKTLNDIYAIIRQFTRPVALFDFVCGEMGYEILCAQALCGEFYDQHKDDKLVVALCWKGCSTIYQNVSDIQIELDDTLVSIQGNDIHRGWPRLEWLDDNEHYEKVQSLSNVREHIGPLVWEGIGCTGGYAPDGYWEEDKANSMKIREIVADRVEHVFMPSQPRIIEEPYIFLFDRNEEMNPWRNTADWQIEFFDDLANGHGLRLVIMSGLFPRGGFREGTINFKPQYRDLDTMCNLVRYATLSAVPSSGAAEVALIFGGDIVLTITPALSDPDRERWHLLSELCARREFEWLGMLCDPNDDAARKVKEFLCQKQYL